MNVNIGLLGGRVLLAGLGVLGVSWALQDGGVLRHQELDNCQIDVRPLNVADEVMLEAQVYFAEWDVADSDKHGTEFVIHVPDDSLLTLGDNAGETPAGDGPLIDLDYGTYYFVRLYWDEEHDNAYIQVSESPTMAIGPGAVHHAAKLTAHDGAFDALGMMADPICEFVRTGPDSEGRRLRITAVNYGLEIGFTLTDSSDG